MKKASLLISEILDNKHNALLEDVYVDASLVEAQKGRYVKAIEKFIELYGDKEVEVLLDGQQRLTVLTNIFSNIIFCNLNDYRKELVSPSLKKQFFIKIPLYKDLRDLGWESRVSFCAVFVCILSEK